MPRPYYIPGLRPLTVFNRDKKPAALIEALRARYQIPDISPSLVGEGPGEG